MDHTTHHRLIARSRHWFHFERLELRTLLSVSSVGNQDPFAPGELLIGFEGEVPAMLESQGAESALDLAQQVVGKAGLHSGRILFDFPASENRAARLATHWQLSESIDVQDVVRQLSQVPGIAYAEPNAILTSQAIPGDASFVGDWQFGVQEHLTQIGAPDAWDITTGDASVVVAVIDTGVDLDHPDLNDNVLAGTTFVEGTATSQDDHGHGTAVAGLVAAEMNNLTELASEAGGDLAWAGGVVGVAPSVSILPVKVLNQDGNGRVSDIAAGINYAVDPDGDPATNDGADIITLSLGGGGVSQVVADAIANAHSQGALVIASVSHRDSEGISYPAMDPYALAVTAVDADDVWDGDHVTGSFVDITAQGVDVLSTFVDREDPSETIELAGAYGRESGSSLSTPIVAGAAALIKSLHPEWGPNEVAGQLLATADSISELNSPSLQGQLGAGRVSASAAVGSTARPRVISLVGLGDVDADAPELSLLESGDRFEVRFSHAMQTTSVLESARYQLKYQGNPDTTSDDQTVELSLVTEALPPDAMGVTDADNYYVPFPGRGVQLQVGDFPGGGSFPAGPYRLRVSGVTSLGGVRVRSLTHEFQVASRANFSDPHLIVQPELDGPVSVIAVDLDGDEDLDLLTASGFDNKVAWYENTDGAGTFGSQRVISTIAVERGSLSYVIRSARAGAKGAVSAADLDGDGDLDVLSAMAADNKIVWYENTDGAGNFGPERVIITVTGVPKVHAADLDSDGDLDVLSASREDDKLAWYENTDGTGTFGPERVITTSLDNPDSVFAADLDGDRDSDVLSFSFSSKEIVWFENTDGQGGFDRRTIATVATTYFIRSVIAADMDRDGDLDILAGEAYDGLALYENTDGTGHFGPRRLLSRNEDDAYHIRAADMDNDGDLDVLRAAGWENDITWLENRNEGGSFGRRHLITRDVDMGVMKFADAADIDNDGDLDVVLTDLHDDKIAWHENVDGAGTFGPQHRVGSGVTSPELTSTSDVDGDGDMDLLYAQPDTTIILQEHINGLGSFGPQRVIMKVLDRDGFDGVSLIRTADLDGDDDLDLITSSYLGNPDWVDVIAWYENTDGLGTYGPQRVIAQEGGGGVYLSSSTTADLDGDGDLDVLSVYGASEDSRIVWYENTNGAGSFGTQRRISQDAPAWKTATAVDLDGDGDLDVMGAEYGGDGGITWYENSDGAGSFGKQDLIWRNQNQGRFGVHDVSAADLDGDGDQDVLQSIGSSATDIYTLAWLENEDGAGTFGPQRVISQGTARRWPATTGDLDDDGDLDVIAAWNNDSSTKTIAFYENVDGAGTFGPQLVITPKAYRGGDAFGNDVDADGDLDVIYTSTRGIFWYENLLAHAGDANRDGRFDSTDLVQVFQAGEYEDDVEDNSTWEEGDWNGDGDFDSSDLVAAFEKGLYERKSRVVAAEIAAVVDWLFADEDRLRRDKAYVA